jgi:type II secretory pathway component PulJ
MRVNGFSLLEFVVYLTIFSFVAVLFLGVISRTQFKFMKNLHEQEVLLRQVLAVDLLRRDLMSASILVSDWDVQMGIFKKMTLTKTGHPQCVCVCWYIGKTGLTRVQGQYDFGRSEWSGKSSSLVSRSINQLRFLLEKNRKGVWVIYKVMGSDQEKKIYVKFRNRVVM